MNKILQIMLLIMWFAAESVAYLKHSLPKRMRVSSWMVGFHGQDFHYLPIYSPEDEVQYPRILHIAGIYPNLTPHELMMPQSPPPAQPGYWMYDFPDPNGIHLGIVALPGSENLSKCIDPIAVISKTTDLGIKMHGEEEVVIVIDRGQRKFSTSDFFAVSTEKDKIQIAWITEQELEKTEILGKVVLCALPKSPRKVSSFLEEEYD
eukprot:gene2487-2644_t